MLPSRENIVEVTDLKTHFFTVEGIVKAVDGVSFTVRKGEVLGVVGESGCGKSVTALSILQLVPLPGRILAGEILYYGEDGGVTDVTSYSPNAREMRRLRGNEIAMVFQDPMTAFNPVYTIGNQVAEAIILHQDTEKSVARERTIELFDRVGISAPEQRVDDYPYQLSGGMRQRAMIAMALSCSPSLLIADEPTTALDVTIEAQILTLLRELKSGFDMSIMMITHDLGVIGEMADQVIVMYMGKIVEVADVNSIFSNPKHPYTLGLLNSIPLITAAERKRLYTIPGSVPNLFEIPEGCLFSPRCPYRMDECREDPPIVEVEDGHQARCWLHRSGG